MVTERIPPQAFWPLVYKKLDFPPLRILILRNCPFLQLFCWNPQPQPPRDLFLLFTNFTPITFHIIYTTLSFQFKATSHYFTWTHVSWSTKSLIHNHHSPWKNTYFFSWALLPVPANKMSDFRKWKNYFSLYIFFFCLFRDTPPTYGSSQATGRTGTSAAGLHHSHSNTRSKPRLQTTPQLMATSDP